jgi:hypothetical protein
MGIRWSAVQFAGLKSKLGSRRGALALAAKSFGLARIWVRKAMGPGGATGDSSVRGRHGLGPAVCGHDGHRWRDVNTGGPQGSAVRLAWDAGGEIGATWRR